MYLSIKKILLAFIVLALPFGSVNAQKKKRKKAVSTKTVVAKKKTATKKASSKKAVTKKQKSNPPLVKIAAPAVIDTKTVNNNNDTADVPKEVIITSAFKPSLRNAAKIIFTAATPLLDTSKMEVGYNIPSQYLSFSYQPITIKPLALAADSGFVWQNNQYIKLGYGNYSSPYAEAGFSFGNGKKVDGNFTAKHVSAKGSLPFQDYSKTDIIGIANFSTANNLAIHTKAFYTQNNVLKYGLQPSNVNFAAVDLQQKYTSIGAEFGLENKILNASNIHYSPKISFNFFGNGSIANEVNMVLKAPITKHFGKLVNLNLGVVADITNYTKEQIPNNATVKNNLYTVQTSVQFKAANFLIKAGVDPTWDNGDFVLLPNITAQSKIIKDQDYVFEAGWQGYFTKNTYRTLVATNPFIDAPNGFANTKTIEQFIGIKGSVGKHFSFNSRISYASISNIPLFVNDIGPAKSQNFIVINEAQINAAKIKAEISYQLQEKIFVLAGVDYTQFLKVKNNDKAFGLVPLTFNGSLKWKIFKDLLLKSNVLMFSGPSFRTQTLQSERLSPAFDANVAAEFSVLPKLNVWVQFNNVFNNKYQLYNQYQVLGFQVLAGVVYSFK